MCEIECVSKSITFESNVCINYIFKKKPKCECHYISFTSTFITMKRRLKSQITFHLHFYRVDGVFVCMCVSVSMNDRKIIRYLDHACINIEFAIVLFYKYMYGVADRSLVELFKLFCGQRFRINRL